MRGPFVCAAVLSLCLAVSAQERVHDERAAPQVTDASALLALHDSISNFNAVTDSLPGASWASGGSPCGAAGSHASEGAWRGITCATGPEGSSLVVGLDLSGLGLEGTLPPQLAALSSLARLNLSANALHGSVPPAWGERGAFPLLRHLDLSRNRLQGALPAWESNTLAVLDVSFNALTGALPASWAPVQGGRAPLPALTAVRLAGNSLSGPVPPALWQLGSLHSPVELELRPGNEQLCGPVVPIHSQLYLRELLPTLASVLPPLPVSDASRMRTGDQTTNLLLTHRDLFAPGTSVSITNRVGSCAARCAEGAQPPAWAPQERLAWPPVVETNLFDVTWKYHMSMADLLLLNPDASLARPGDALVPACHGSLPQFAYFGGDAAFGQFAGGNQRAGIKGLGGAMAASRINGALLNKYNPDDTYQGCILSDGSGVARPSWWFVDMQARFQVTSVVLAAGSAMPNVTLYIGSDSASVAANTLVASGLSIAAGRQLVVPTGGASGRYVVIYAGEHPMALDNVQVYTSETNAAAHKRVAATVHDLLSSSSGSAEQQPLHALTDGDASTCVTLQRGSGDAASAVIDLGYTAAVGSIAVAAGAGVPAGAAVQLMVHPAPGSSPGGEVACGARSAAPLTPSSWAALACNATGRFVEVRVAAAVDAVELCELQAHLLVPPAPPAASPVGSSSQASASWRGMGAAVLTGTALLAAYAWWNGRPAVAGHQQVSAAAAERPESLKHSGSSSDEGHLAPGSLAAYHAATPPTVGTPLSALSSRNRSGGSGGSSRSNSGRNAVAAAGNGSGGSQGSGQPLHRRPSMDAVSAIFAMLSKAGGAISRRSTAGSSGDGRGEPPPPSNPSSRGGSGSTVGRGATDLRKLPPDFADVSPADITLVHSLGEGSFGEVWLANYCNTQVAAKIFTQIKASNLTASLAHQAMLNSLWAEASLMSNLRHPNICRYLGACTEPPCLVMEYCSRRSLDMLLADGLRSPKTREQLRWPRLLRMALDAATGMRYLHTRSPCAVAHRDLKSANLLVDNEWRVKVSDFNLSRSVESSKAASTVLMTNPRWLAPCVLSGLPGQLAADIWAFGTVMWELMTWHLPFEDLNAFQIILAVREKGTDSLEPPANDALPAGQLSCYREYVELMRHCRAADPDARPTFDDIVPRLRALVEMEDAARHPERASPGSQPPRRAPTPERAFKLAPEGPAYRAAIAQLQQRRAALKGHAAPGAGDAGSSAAPAAGPPPQLWVRPAAPPDSDEQGMLSVDAMESPTPSDSVARQLTRS